MFSGSRGCLTSYTLVHYNRFPPDRNVSKSWRVGARNCDGGGWWGAVGNLSGGICVEFCECYHTVKGG
eukprot:140472-Hanusia_phi.AAC.2